MTTLMLLAANPKAIGTSMPDVFKQCNVDYLAQKDKWCRTAIMYYAMN